MSAGEELRRLQEIRDSVGRHHVTFEFLTEKPARSAWRRIEQRCQGVSAWRYTTPERRRHYVTAMGEDPAIIAKARRVLLAAGGHEKDAPPDPGMVEGFQARRWSSAVQAARQGRRTVHDVAHYGRGVRLDRQGRMSPHERPQG